MSDKTVSITSLAIAVLTQLEIGHQLLQARGLSRHFLRRRRQLLGRRRVSLRDLVHLGHGPVDLAHADRLLLAEAV